MNDDNAPITILPDLQASLLCDDIRQERNGKFMFIGIFEALVVGTIPTTIGKINVVNRWCSGVGPFVQQTRIVEPDGETIVREGRKVNFTLQDETAVATSIENFSNLVFTTEGKYWVEIHLCDRLKIRYPLTVRLRTKQPS